MGTKYIEEKRGLKMEMTYGNSGDFARDFEKAVKEAKRRGLQYVISRISSDGKSLGGSFAYEFLITDHEFSLAYEKVVGMDSIYDVVRNDYFDKQDFLLEYARLLSEDKRRSIIDRMLADFLSGKFTK